MALRVITTITADDFVPAGEKLVVVVKNGRKFHCSAVRHYAPHENVHFNVDVKSWTDDIRDTLDQTVKDRSELLGVGDEEPVSREVITSDKLEVGGCFDVEVLTTYSHDHLSYPRHLSLGVIKELVIPS